MLPLRYPERSRRASATSRLAVSLPSTYRLPSSLPPTPPKSKRCATLWATILLANSGVGSTECLAEVRRGKRRRIKAGGLMILSLERITLWVRGIRLAASQAARLSCLGPIRGHKHRATHHSFETTSNYFSTEHKTLSTHSRWMSIRW